MADVGRAGYWLRSQPGDEVARSEDERQQDEIADLIDAINRAKEDYPKTYKAAVEEGPKQQARVATLKEQRAVESGAPSFATDRDTGEVEQTGGAETMSPEWVAENRRRFLAEDKRVKEARAAATAEIAAQKAQETNDAIGRIMTAANLQQQKWRDEAELAGGSTANIGNPLGIIRKANLPGEDWAGRQQMAEREAAMLAAEETARNVPAKGELERAKIAREMQAASIPPLTPQEQAALQASVDPEHLMATAKLANLPGKDEFIETEIERQIRAIAAQGGEPPNESMLKFMRDQLALQYYLTYIQGLNQRYANYDPTFQGGLQMPQASGGTE